jgi:hypothetical protein
LPDNPNIPGIGPTAADDVNGVYVPRMKLQLGVDGQAADAPGDTTHGLRVDTRRAIATTVGSVDAAGGPLPLSGANANRKKFIIVFDAPPTERVLILEGGNGPVTADNWSFDLYGGDYYEADPPSSGAYMALWDNQSAPVGTLRITEG